MATVVLSREIARRFSDGCERIEVSPDARTVRAVIRELDQRFPGIAGSLRGAVAIDGQIYQNCLFEPVPAEAEVCFLPAIEGG